MVCRGNQRGTLESPASSLENGQRFMEDRASPRTPEKSGNHVTFLLIDIIRGRAQHKVEAPPVGSLYDIVKPPAMETEVSDSVCVLC
jgi:hypothetical protein